MLNAFRHHGIGHALRSTYSAFVHNVLNAFRHHGIGHFRLAQHVYFDGVRAQRLPASWNRSRDPIKRSPFYNNVLNAFRHHGIGHPPITVIRLRLTTCSTPSGIMESVTHHHRTSSSSIPGAQRLPASWNRSRFWGVPFNAKYEECSTPSGIMESVTRRR